MYGRGSERLIVYALVTLIWSADKPVDDCFFMYVHELFQVR